MFLQIHFLTSYHATLLNRDDVGLAKRISFGGHQRLRVSSQCQKRHWREWMLNQTDLPRGFRTRYFFDRVVKRRLVEAGLDGDLAHDLILHLSTHVLTAAGGKKALDQETLAMKQPVLFGKPEADYFVGLLLEAAQQGDKDTACAWLDEALKKSKANFKALLQQAGIEEPAVGFEGALFGRFVTSDILARVDAPVHVAHAFTTHALDTEVDYFTVVDDLAEDETGAAHANEMELGGGVYYGYIVVDIPLLISNLTGCDPTEWQSQDKRDAYDLLHLLIHAAAQVTPGAKLGATAPYARAECVVLEVGTDQPRSLANAFLKPISVRSTQETLMELSIGALGNYISSLESMYGKDDTERFVATTSPGSWARTDERVVPLPEAVAESLRVALGDPS